MSKKDKTQPQSQENQNENITEQNNIESQTSDKESQSESSPSEQDNTALIQAEEKISKLQQQLAEANDKHLRLFSEFDNFRKRSVKERLELINTASTGVISALLPVIDDLERASKIAAESQEKHPANEGIILIYNKLKNILSQKGVEEIKSVGEIFDTDYHEAITHIPAQDESQKGKIIDEVQKGYLLGGKVIRHSRVVVAN